MKPKYHDIIRECPAADTAVILLHGILSAPQFFDFLLPEIPETVSVYGLLLDGHGSSPEALAHTSMQKWKQQIRDLTENLLPRYEKIIIAAHSMGTLFALELAEAGADQTDAAARRPALCTPDAVWCRMLAARRLRISAAE